jgi:GT2 family glycosyltransferase
MLSNQPLVSIVILNWNGKHWLQQFLPSVMASDYPNLKVIVGDNCSTDDSIEFLQSQYPTVGIIRNEVNLGFAGGYNEVLKKVKSDYYILLNSDVEVGENWIQPIISFLEKSPMMAAAQPKIKSFYEKEKFEYAGAAGGYIDKNGYMFCRGRLFNTTEIDTHQYNVSDEVFWASGACLFIKASLYHLVGGLDEMFFAHQEEIDLCWRLQNAGYTIGYCSEATVYHVGGGMLAKSNPKKTYLNFRNSLYLLYKNLPFNKLLVLLPKRLLLDFIAAIQFLLKGNLQDAAAVLKAYINFVSNFSKISSTKTKMKQSGIYKFDSFKKANQAFYNGSIVWEHFILKKSKFSEIKFNPRS